jgi:glycosyltransferase involved in cell wall biosynthesis
MRITKSKPLISVIIPVYNGNGYLATAINSILNQTYKNFEIIAIDDGSIDNSYDILKSLAKSDKRLRIFKNSKNLNISRTLNRGIKLAKGDYIARMDADDIALPNRFTQQMNFLLKHPQVVILGGQCKTIDVNGKLMGKKLFPVKDAQIREALYTTNPIQHPTAIINKALLPKNFAWYNPQLPPAEDYDLFFRLGQFGKYHNLPRFLLKYRQYIGSSTFKNPVKTFSVTRKVRRLARTQYGYKPSLRATLTHILQVAIISIIPGFLVYPTYVLVRGIRSPRQLLADYLGELKYFPSPTSKSDKVFA